MLPLKQLILVNLRRSLGTSSLKLARKSLPLLASGTPTWTWSSATRRAILSRELKPLAFGRWVCVFLAFCRVGTIGTDHLDCRTGFIRHVLLEGISREFTVGGPGQANQKQNFVCCICASTQCISLSEASVLDYKSNITCADAPCRVLFQAVCPMLLEMSI